MASVSIGVFLLIYEFINKKRHLKTVGWNKSTVFGGMLCGFALFVASNLQQYGLIYTSAGKSGFITALYIVIVPVLGLLALKKIGALSRFAIPVAIAGFWLMCSGEGNSVGKGELFGLGSTVFFAFQILFVDEFAQDSDPIKLTFVQFVTCALMSIAGMGVVGFPDGTVIKESIVSLVYVGVFSAGIGYTLQTVGQKYTEPSVASLIMSLESVVGMIGGALILHEEHSLLELAGCTLVFVAVILAQISFPKNTLQFDRNRFILTSKNSKFKFWSGL